MRVIKQILVCFATLIYTVFCNAQSTHYLNYDGWYFAGVSYPISIYGVKDSKTSLDVPSSVIDYGYVNSWTAVGKLSEKIFAKTGGYWSKISSAKTATIPSSITTMGDNVFLNNDVIESVTVNASINIPTSTFDGCTSLKSVKWPNATVVGEAAFRGCSSLQSMSFLSYVTTYNKYAFKQSGLSIFEFGNYTKTIGEEAFAGVNSPEILNLPNTLQTIGTGAFKDCTGLRLVNFGNGEINIGSSAFSGCTNLKYLIFGSSIKSIGNNAFYDCDKITAIYINNPTPPTCSSGAFLDEVKKNATLFVPKGSYSAYWSSTEWEDFKITEQEFEIIGAINIAETFSIVKDTRVRLPFSISPETASIPNLIFESSDTSIVAVSSDGFIEGKSAGTAVITISSQDGSNLQAKCKITVTEPEIIEFIVSPTSLVLNINEQANINISIKPENTNKSVNWVSTNEDIAVVKEKDGVAIVLARAIGEADIIVSSVEYPDISAICHVVVVEDDILVGDVNEDGLVDKRDLDELVDILLNRRDSTDAADVNKDGLINGQDFVVLSHKINGK